MKKTITLLVTIATMLTSICWAQAPQKMSYQAIIRNASNTLVTNATVGMQISILQTTSTGTAVYVETQTPTTNANGLVSIEIGTGTVVSGTFSAIDWSAGPYFIKIETDPAGGTNYTITGTSQLASVPYALYAESTGPSSPLDNAEYSLPDQNLSWGTSGTVSFAAQQFTVPAGKHDVLVQFAFNIRGYFFTWGKYTVELYDVTNSVSIKQIDVQYKTTISNPTYGGSNPTADIPFARTYTLNTAVDTVYQINVIYSFATGDANTSGNITAGNVIVRKVN
ncbi:hypothetical protein [Lutibacter sp.]